MLFKIKAVNAQGQKQDISIDAVSEAEAVRRVADYGWTVTTIEVFPYKEPDSTSPGEAYPAISIYATIARFMGLFTIVFGLVAAFTVGSARDGNLVFAFGVLVAGFVSGTGQLAFAELLDLFVRMQTNTQYICERLYALEQQAKSPKQAEPSSAPQTVNPA